jgi:heme exporter protein D
MNWGSASEFFSMGGNGAFVWGSYGLFFLVVALEPWLARRRRQAALQAAAATASAEDEA